MRENGKLPESASDFIARKTAEWRSEQARAIRTKDIGRQGVNSWIREAWTFHVQGNYPEKVLLIERLRYAEFTGTSAIVGGAGVGDVEYRFGYYVVGRIGRAAGKWTWGQFAPFIPRTDLDLLLTKAREEGTLLSAAA